ncbi:SUMF1/EgtB/PvdO family nonheme iron enzyme [Streptomyces sp. NPDC049954]|uniref:formylglycine-generating enzyme family protein n=1 Tax=Streptomyces sp. NPDC049954 TaxID=3155779 RepID=UPI003425C83B
MALKATHHLMTDVPAGRVTLSDRRSQRSWTVDLAPFRLAAFPVTEELYAEITGARETEAASGPAPREGLPVTGVSWLEAARFCNALSLHEGCTPAYAWDSDGEGATWDRSADGYRLPTEAEWEHACRAGTTGPHYGPLDAIAWYRDNSAERVHPVGGKQPNAWGLHDMLGNAWDWCWDLYDPEVYGSYRVLRGGGWFDEHWSLRASARRRSHPSFQVDDVGFRVARSA